MTIDFFKFVDKATTVKELSEIYEKYRMHLKLENRDHDYNFQCHYNRKYIKLKGIVSKKEFNQLDGCMPINIPLDNITRDNILYHQIIQHYSGSIVLTKHIRNKIRNDIDYWYVYACLQLLGSKDKDTKDVFLNLLDSYPEPPDNPFDNIKITDDIMNDIKKIKDFSITNKSNNSIHCTIHIPELGYLHYSYYSVIKVDLLNGLSIWFKTNLYKSTALKFMFRKKDIESNLEKIIDLDGELILKMEEFSNGIR